MNMLKMCAHTDGIKRMRNKEWISECMNKRVNEWEKGGGRGKWKHKGGGLERGY